MEAIDFDPNKCLIVGEPEVLVSIADRINTEQGESIGSLPPYPYFLEVVPVGVDKAIATIGTKPPLEP